MEMTSASEMARLQYLEEMVQSAEKRMRLTQSEMVKRGMARKLAEGFPVSRVPIGYQRIGRDGKWVIKPHPVQSRHVLQAFLLAAEGQDSVMALHKAMTGQGLANRDGKTISLSGFRSMLANPFYLGMLRSDNGLLPGKHQSIVTAETFELTQKWLHSDKRNHQT